MTSAMAAFALFSVACQQGSVNWPDYDLKRKHQFYRYGLITKPLHLGKHNEAKPIATLSGVHSQLLTIYTRYNIMRSAHKIIMALLLITMISVLSVGCASRQHVSSHVSDTDFSRYVQKYPKMGEAVRQGRLSKDAAYSLRNIAPQEEIMNQFFSKVEAKRTEIDAKHIPEAEKRRLLREYIHQNQMAYVNAANAAGRQAQQEEQALGHSPFAR